MGEIRKQLVIRDYCTPHTTCQRQQLSRAWLESRPLLPPTPSLAYTTSTTTHVAERKKIVQLPTTGRRRKKKNANYHHINCSSSKAPQPIPCTTLVDVITINGIFCATQLWKEVDFFAFRHLFADSTVFVTLLWTFAVFLSGACDIYAYFWVGRGR